MEEMFVNNQVIHHLTSLLSGKLCWYHSLFSLLLTCDWFWESVLWEGVWKRFESIYWDYMGSIDICVKSVKTKPDWWEGEEDYRPNCSFHSLCSFFDKRLAPTRSWSAELPGLWFWWWMILNESSFARHKKAKVCDFVWWKQWVLKNNDSFVSCALETNLSLKSVTVSVTFWRQ